MLRFFFFYDISYILIFTFHAHKKIETFEKTAKKDKNLKNWEDSKEELIKKKEEANI